ncbi:MAG: sigma-54-dependent Fis family transcriptional regulator [Candidatus Dadabacteria bacterium]|nr:MAG: sigma-54-dependent Fis family transcriptional regulator [Candidatus Dadabacteria bacterium]
MDSPNILIIDDESEAASSLAKALKTEINPLHCDLAASEQSALSMLNDKQYPVAILDLCLNEQIGPESGFSLLESMLSQHPDLSVIVLTGYGTVENGVRALKLGAISFIEKPANIPHLAILVQDGIRQNSLKRRFRELQEASSDKNTSLGIIGSSAEIKQIRDTIRFLATTNQSVLITGETGTGKGLCAQAIHRISTRNKGKLVRYQPNFTTPDLVNSDLFGHVKGAFTGADQERKGLLEEADGGTLFLDEIDELPHETQVALLGVLQDKKYRPLGSNEEREVDFRLICATNREIEQLLKEGKLRKDFYHRIAHEKIHLPPLRLRIEDIPELADYFLTSLREREELSVFRFEASAISTLKGYHWPGNIRELQSVVESAAYRAQFKRSSSISQSDITVGSEGSAVSEKPDATFRDLVEQYKLSLINNALAKHNNNQVQAAKSLGLDRTTLRRILARNKDK